MSGEVHTTTDRHVIRKWAFDKFEDQRLAFVYQDTLKDGQTSRFSKFVSRDAH